MLSYVCSLRDFLYSEFPPSFSSLIIVILFKKYEGMSDGFLSLYVLTLYKVFFPGSFISILCWSVFIIQIRIFLHTSGNFWLFAQT